MHIIEIDISQAGGRLETKRIADLAFVYNIPVATLNVMGPVDVVREANTDPRISAACPPSPAPVAAEFRMVWLLPSSPTR